MPIDLDRLNRLIRERDTAARDKERAEGASETILARLKKEYSVDSIEEAEAAARKAEKEATRLEAEFNKELAKLEEEFKNDRTD